MSAEILRKAAEVLREKAEKATPGPWVAHGRGDDTEVRQVRPDLVGGRFNQVAALNGWNEESDEGADDLNAAYIATMHPGVGLALADWLDAVAQVWQIAEDVVDPDGDPLTFGASIDSHALPLARLILGGAS